MQVLLLQFVDPTETRGLPVFSHELGVLGSRLKEHGFACRLLALRGHRSDELRRAVIEHRPRYVLAEVEPHSVAAAHRTLVELSETYSLPVGVLGVYATCRPTDALSVPGVRALVLGEYDSTALALLESVRDGADPAGIDGLWVRNEEGVVRGRLPDLRDDLDSLPAPDRELFGYERIVSATGEAHFKTSRGCRLWCAFCPNDWYMDLYEGRGTFVRRRSVGNVLHEVRRVLDRYPQARRAVFLDHHFATDADWLKAFADAWPDRCGVPFRCWVPLSGVTEAMATELSRAGCDEVHVHLGAGSRFIREEVLSIRLDDDAIVGACGVLRRAGLRVVAKVLLGCPYESEVSIEETVELAQRAEADEVRAEVFYPTPGTRTAELCGEKGWISGRGEENYWEGRSVLDMPSMPAEHIRAVASEFPRLVKGPPGNVRGVLRKVSRTRRRGLRDLLGGR
jgi:radical SAM superfamily enzyme YgiQ (UPF0313 family)